MTATRRRGNHQTVLSAMMIPAGVRYRPRRRGQGGSPIVVVESWNYVCIDNFGVLPAAYPTTAARGRYQPTFIWVIIATMIPWLVLRSERRGDYDNRGRHYCHFGHLCCVTHRSSTLETSLNFRGSANKRPTKRGCHQKRKKIASCCDNTGHV